ncbi:MAG TPA: hypothetical protein VMD75_03285 [Candidatus Binataceae bacterium]|nr:hypothetical protein [Candidatus Binataceae bacterium]
MTSYRVCFMNEFPRNDKLFRCCQRSVLIRSARSRERALKAAKKRFARLEGIPHWKIHASFIEIEPVDIRSISEAVGPQPEASDRARGQRSAERMHKAKVDLA